jgi:hypothetical protein
MGSFKLNWPIFLISFAISISIVYLISVPPKVVFKYPNPYNVGKVVYQDPSEDCYVYNATQVQCTKDAISNPINKHP